MIGWILGIVRSITGSINNVINWITNIIAAVYSFIDREVSALGNEIVSVWHSADSLFQQAWHYIVQVYDFAVSIVNVIIHNVIVWVQRIWNDLYSYAHGVYETLVSWVDFLRHWIAVLIDDLRSWVINDIWHPLFTGLSDAIKWITHEGALAYYLLTHPDKLAAILAKWLWQSYIDLLKTFGKVIGRWLLVSMRDLAGPFLDILEAILSGIL